VIGGFPIPAFQRRSGHKAVGISLCRWPESKIAMSAAPFIQAHQGMRERVFRVSSSSPCPCVAGQAVG